MLILTRPLVSTRTCAPITWQHGCQRSVLVNSCNHQVILESHMIVLNATVHGHAHSTTHHGKEHCSHGANALIWGDTAVVRESLGVRVGVGCVDL